MASPVLRRDFHINTDGFVPTRFMRRRVNRWESLSGIDNSCHRYSDLVGKGKQEEDFNPYNFQGSSCLGGEVELWMRVFFPVAMLKKPVQRKGGGNMNFPSFIDSEWAR